MNVSVIAAFLVAYHESNIKCRDPLDHELKTNCDARLRHSRGKGKKVKDWDKRGR